MNDNKGIIVVERNLFVLNIRYLRTVGTKFVQDTDREHVGM